VETYSTKVQVNSLRLIVAIAAISNWNLEQLDIKTVYLNTKLDIIIITSLFKNFDISLNHIRPAYFNLHKAFSITKIYFSFL